MNSIGEGAVLGHYRLVRRIGEGGMGEVYLAQRESDFEKRVAIKVIRPEMVNSDIVRRFTIERQTMAALDHPNIVKLLDGGATPEGMPYLVVDYVEGIPIDRYANERRLDVPQRLRLFLKVCEAVHSAHRSLVVHCDLKPGNILVTAQGEPMLLDFGIAKLLDPQAVGVRMLVTGETRAGFTPQYASPEQMLGLAVTTSTDTYALGVILYELLTGRPPHDMSGSMADWMRSICERDAEAPSTAVRRTSQQPAASQPGSVLRDWSAVERMLRGDVDAIVLKALRKEPRDRYASVDQFADDIRRQLDGRPVLARQNTARYVMRKFLTRHKWGVAAACAALLLLSVGVGSTVYQARIAAGRFNELRALSHTFLFDVHDAIQDLPGSTPARSLIAGTGTSYLDRLAADARGDRSLQIEVAEGYLKIGDVQGNPFVSNLGDLPKAMESYRKALAIADAVGASDVKSTQLAARVHENLASVLPFDAKLPEAIQHARQAIGLYQAVAGMIPQDVEAKLDLARGHETLGDLQGGANGINAGQVDEAEKTYRTGLSLIPRLADGHPLAVRATRARAVLNMKLGDILSRRMSPTAAMTQYQTALADARKVLAVEPNNARHRNMVSMFLTRIAGAYSDQEQNDLAEATYKQGLELNEAALSADPTNDRARNAVAVSQQNLGNLYFYNFHRFPEALACYQRAAGLLELLSRSDPANIVWKQNLSESLSFIASTLVEMKRPAEARPVAVRSLRLSKEVADRPGATHDQIYNYAWLAITMDPEDLRDPQGALPYALKASEMTKGRDSYDLHVLGRIYSALKDFVRAEEFEAKAFALYPPLPPGETSTGARQTVERDLAEYRAALGKGDPPKQAALVPAKLAPKELAPKPAPVAFALEDWLSIPGWRRDGAMVRRQGGEFALAPTDFSAATIEFTAAALRGKRLAWVLAYRDLRNYELFEMDEKSLTRVHYSNGRREGGTPVAHGLARGTAARVRAVVSPTGIEHYVFRDNAWWKIDDWHGTSGRGKFGFHVSGRDEMGLSEFRLTVGQ